LPQRPRNMTHRAVRRIEFDPDPVLVPPPVDQSADFLTHLDLFRPRSRALVWALRGGVDTQLAAEELMRRRVVEVVERALADHDVAGRVDVGTDVEEDQLVVVDVYMLSDDVHRLGEAEHAEPPDRVHDLLGMTGEGLADRDDAAVV